MALQSKSLRCLEDANDVGNTTEVKLVNRVPREVG